MTTVDVLAILTGATLCAAVSVLWDLRPRRCRAAFAAANPAKLGSIWSVEDTTERQRDAYCRHRRGHAGPHFARTGRRSSMAWELER